MRRHKMIATYILLFFVELVYHVNAAGFNAAKESTNEKDLKIIEGKLEEGLSTIKGTWEKINTMKIEQHVLELDLQKVLENNPEAPENLKTMLEDQKQMQEEIAKIQVNVKEAQCKFTTWIKDIQEFQKNPNGMATYEALKPFIREMDALTDQFKLIPKKITEQAKRYKQFGESMLESDIIDIAVNKRICVLATMIEESGFQISDIGDPIALTSDLVTNIWQRTYARDKDTTLSQVTLKLTPKANGIVSDGDSQANSGTALKKICKKLEEKAKDRPPESEGATEGDPEKCKNELDEIVNDLTEFTSEGSNFEKLKERLEEIMKLEIEFESIVENTPGLVNVSREIEDLADSLSKIKQEILAEMTKVGNEKQCDGKAIENFGNKIQGLFSIIWGVTKGLEQSSGKLLSNGKNLVDKGKYKEEFKSKYDVIGEKIKSSGGEPIDKLLPSIEGIAKRFTTIANLVGTDSQNMVLAIGNIIEGIIGPIKAHGQKAGEYGTDIVALEVSPEPTESEIDMESTTLNPAGDKSSETATGSEGPKSSENEKSTESTKSSGSLKDLISGRSFASAKDKDSDKSSENRKSSEKTKKSGKSNKSDGSNRIEGSKKFKFEKKFVTSKNSGGKKKSGSKSTGIGKAHAKEIDQMQTDMDVIWSNLLIMSKEMDVIKSEQEAVELEVGKAYGKKNAVPRRIHDLHRDCKKLAHTAKNLERDLRKGKKASLDDLEKIAKKILALSEKILSLAEKIEDLGKKILTNGQGLQKKGLLSSSVADRLKHQGQKIGSCGGKLQNIAEKMEGIGSNLGKIGEKLEADNGETFNEASRKLKAAGGILKTKAENVGEHAVQLQNFGNNEDSKTKN